MSWPWLKDAKICDQPTAVPEEKRNGRSVVAELMVEHAKSIAELRAAIQEDPLYEPTKHDDLWLLRFLLSHKGKVARAAKACKHTLVFRKTHRLDESDIRFQPPSISHPRTKSFLAYGDGGAVLGVHLPDPTRGVITYIHLTELDQHGLIANVADEDVESFFIHLTEWCHQWLDYVTRTTGLLTKSIRILDVKGMTLAKINRACLKRNAHFVNAMEDCYPQLLQSVFPCHSLALLQTFWTTLRPILPARLVSKIDFIDPEHRRKDLDKLLQHIDEENLPERFGGKSKAWPVLTTLPTM